MISRRLVLSLSLLAAIAMPASVLAQSQDYDVRPDAAQVTGPALTEAFKGVSHEGAYNFNSRGRPGSLFTERHFADGRVAYTEQGLTIKGQWAITPGNTICYAYDSDNIGGGCFRVYKLGSCYYFYSTFRVEREDEIDQDYWTARSVKKGDRATCEDMIS